MNSKVISLAVITIFVFGTVYAGIAVEDADAVKSKNDKKFKSAKAKKGWLAQKMQNYPHHS